jgi:tetratricopeptide (TPR) repeat protein
LHRQTAETADKDSSGNLKTGDSSSKANLRIRGAVATADGALPGQLIEIRAVCPTFERTMAIADSKGKFSFSFEPGRLAGIAFTKDCVLFASLEGFRSERVSLKAGTLALEPMARDSTGLVSATGQQASAAQQKLYDKASDKAARQDWKGAIVTLRELVSANPSYGSAWLNLGILQEMQNDPAGAERSYLESVRADAKFAPPLVRAAALEAQEGKMPAALAHSQSAMDINPLAFPDAYALNAIANVTLQNIAAAEKSARAGLQLDTTHQYPELEYALGLVLYVKDDRRGAEEYFQKYLADSPSGAHAAAARNQLAQMAEADAAVKRLASSGDRSAEPSKLVLTTDANPSMAALRNQNAPLLAKMSSYTCLESISATKIDVRGKALPSDILRVDIAVSDGKEVYGQADGKRLAEAVDLLGYSFSTTGLFKSIAPALLAENQVQVEPAGEFLLSAEPVLRYNFHSLLGATPWTISHGNESGSAAEEGWLLVDKKSLIPRRVNLSALIDYEPETLADRRVLLPAVAEIEVAERSGIKRVSVISFDHCRAFTADSTVSFIEANFDTQNAQKAGPRHLPDGMDVAVSLNSPLSAAIADKNDIITAAVTEPVLWKGRELIAKGALVEGHVRPKLGQNALVIQLDRVLTNFGWAPFYAQLTSLNAGGQAQIQQSALEIPGVAAIAFNAQTAGLPAGTQLVWRTEPLSVAPKNAQTPQLNTSMGLK